VKSVISQSSVSISQSGMSGVSEQSASVAGSQSVVLESYKRLKFCGLLGFLKKDFEATDFLAVSSLFFMLKAPFLATGAEELSVELPLSVELSVELSSEESSDESSDQS